MLTEKVIQAHFLWQFFKYTGWSVVPGLEHRAGGVWPGLPGPVDPWARGSRTPGAAAAGAPTEGAGHGAQLPGPPLGPAGFYQASAVRYASHTHGQCFGSALLSMRIRIQNFRSLADPNPDPDPGFDQQNLRKNYDWKNTFLSVPVPFKRLFF